MTDKASPVTDEFGNLPPVEPWDVTCARCGHAVSTNDAVAEEGDEWECLPCNSIWDKYERLTTEVAELRALLKSGPTPTVDAEYAKSIAFLEEGAVWADEACVVALAVIRQLERKCAAQREALESICIFARDCIDTGHDRGALGNLYAITDLCDAMLAADREG